MYKFMRSDGIMAYNAATTLDVEKAVEKLGAASIQRAGIANADPMSV